MCSLHVYILYMLQEIHQTRKFINFLKKSVNLQTHCFTQGICKFTKTSRKFINFLNDPCSLLINLLNSQYICQHKVEGSLCFVLLFVVTCWSAQVWSCKCVNNYTVLIIGRCVTVLVRTDFKISNSRKQIYWRIVEAVLWS